MIEKYRGVLICHWAVLPWIRTIGLFHSFHHAGVTGAQEVSHER